MSALQQMMVGGGGGPRTYATWNPSDKATPITLSGGDLRAVMALSNTSGVRGTLSKSSGKWYWEALWNETNTGRFGIATSALDLNTAPGQSSTAWVVKGSGTAVYNAGTVFSFSLISAGSIVGLALDLDALTLSAYVNNVPIGAFSGLPSATDFFPVAGSGSTMDITANFGASALTYSPPSGFNAGFYN